MIMREIYSRAEQVLIWLGEETEEERNGFEVIKKLHDILSVVTEEDARTYPAKGNPQWDSLLECAKKNATGTTRTSTRTSMVSTSLGYIRSYKR